MAGAIVGGGALLSASIEVLLHRMASREVLTFLRRQRLSATLLRKLRIKLLAVQVVLDDAEAKQFTKSAVKDWLDDLKDAVYDAEDLLDDITTEALRCKWSLMLKPAQLRVEEITDKLEYLAQEKDVLGLKEGVGEKLSQRWPATSLVDESGEVYGREGNIQEIVEYLLSHNASGNKISVIALVGLAVLERPHLLSWITKTILKEIDSGASEKYSDDSDLNLLQLKVKERLITTRSDKVAWVMRSVHIHHLGQLSFEDCWSLFAKHAFENGDSSLRPELEEIGKGIVKKCKGLPLATKTLGGALYSELRVKEWEFVLNSETWDLPNDEILPALRHSKVKEMPSHMGQLKSLQKLSNYIVGKQSGTRVGELRELSHIGGSLVIQELQNVVDAKDASKANLVGWQNLDELELEWNRGSNVEQNGADIVLNNLQPHSNLKRLTIYGYGGSRFPDWLGPSVLNMVSLRLWNCTNVSTFPPLGQLPSLKHLYISGLEEIERVGAEFYGTEPSFVSLKALSFQGMPKWKEWLCMGGQGGEFPRLKELCIERCPKLIGALPNHLPLLTELEIEECEQLVAQLPRIPAIRVLTTRSCDISQWKELPPLLQDLAIQNSDSLESLLEEGMLQSNTCLRELRIINCSFSRPLCRVCLPITLKWLHIECKKLEFLLPEFLKCHQPSLAYLFISGSTCNSLSSFPLGNFPSLTILNISDLKGLESLSISISEGDVTSFHKLYIRSCPNLVSIELPALDFSRYSIFNCKNLKWLLHNATCFQSLTIERCPELIFPIQGLQGLSSLTSLKISDLPNLMSLDSLELQLLTSLEKLEIRNCPKLQFLTEEQLPTNLSVLTIQNCPLLKDRCKFWTGEDWHHIAHIPHIVIDDQVSSSVMLHSGSDQHIFIRNLLRLPCLISALFMTLFLDNSSRDFLHPKNHELILCWRNYRSSTLLESGGCSRLYDSTWIDNNACFQSSTSHGCPELIFPMQGLPSNLNSLTITNCNKLTSHMDCGLQGLASLTSLKISGLPNLRSRDSLGLQLLTSLQKLEIRDCPKLQSLTEKLLPTSLSVPTIQNCPLLKGQCKFWTREDWHHIAHIPNIVIDDQVL
ncbi:putative disease resistance RPP13-like protein 1 [Vitis vinifera]|uniref:Putative disease resistance RPP13-like protein 1 n=1 Tax=Vitis vinifera TaxID=29760 RepID=A0A438CMS0_VITVI|nr:putative disease resistance RPP13-like protein 1 [Vitis vinifera]